jgi:hypothetical protein
MHLRTLHYIHHKYNKEHTLSPFAGLAFHPLDGILQVPPMCPLCPASHNITAFTWCSLALSGVQLQSARALCW